MVVGIQSGGLEDEAPLIPARLISTRVLELLVTLWIAQRAWEDNSVYHPSCRLSQVGP